MMLQYSSEIISVTPQTHDVFMVQFKKPGTFSYLAGQYVQFVLPDGTKRSYSLSSVPTEDTLSCCIKRIEGGKASAYICDLTSGAEINFYGPVGHFTERPTANHVFIATGVGISPIIGILGSLANRSFGGSISLLFGLRFTEDIFLQEEINNWKNSLPDFSSTITLSQSATTTSGFAKGRVTAHLTSIAPSEDTTYYLCGSRAMVIEVRKKLLDLGVSPKDILFEIF